MDSSLLLGKLQLSHYPVMTRSQWEDSLSLSCRRSFMEIITKDSSTQLLQNLKFLYSTGWTLLKSLYYRLAYVKQKNIEIGNFGLFSCFFFQFLQRWWLARSDGWPCPYVSVCLQFHWKLNVKLSKYHKLKVICPLSAWW